MKSYTDSIKPKMIKTGRIDYEFRRKVVNFSETTE